MRQILTFSAQNQGPISVDVSIIDDDLVEGDETLNVELSIEAPFTSLAEAGDPSNATITIEDNDGMYMYIS